MDTRCVVPFCRDAGDWSAFYGVAVCPFHYESLKQHGSTDGWRIHEGWPDCMCLRCARHMHGFMGGWYEYRYARDTGTLVYPCGEPEQPSPWRRKGQLRLPLHRAGSLPAAHQ